MLLVNHKLASRVLYSNQMPFGRRLVSPSSLFIQKPFLIPFCSVTFSAAAMHFQVTAVANVTCLTGDRACTVCCSLQPAGVPG